MILTEGKKTVKIENIENITESERNELNIAFQELELDNNVYYYTLKESNEIDDEEKQQQEDEQEGPDGKLELIIDNINRDIFEKASSYRLFQSRIYYGYLPEHEFITSIQNQNKFSYNEKDSLNHIFIIIF